MALANVLAETYFYPRPPRGGRRLKPNHKSAKLRISIHALREEGDEKTPRLWYTWGISIHALREEGDGRSPRPTAHRWQFLSTPSARRATWIL